MNMNNEGFIFVDAETESLRSKNFISISALEVDKNYNILSVFHEQVNTNNYIYDDWINKNIIANLRGSNNVHETYEGLLMSFSKYWEKVYTAKEVKPALVGHMTQIVESNLMQAMYEHKFIHEFGGDYFRIDLSTVLWMQNEQMDSVDTYIEKYELKDLLNENVNKVKARLHRPDYTKSPSSEYKTHNSLYDCCVDYTVMSVIQSQMRLIYNHE